ncbi:hypothetical protein KCU91_g3627, partial [Aureobasidium melanogenum]
MPPSLRSRKSVSSLPPEPPEGSDQDGSYSAAPSDDSDDVSSSPEKRPRGRPKGSGAKPKQSKKVPSPVPSRAQRKRKRDLKNDGRKSKVKASKTYNTILPALKPVTIPISNVTKNTNKWLKVKNTLSVKEAVAITDIPSAPKKLELCDVAGSNKSRRPDPKAAGYKKNIVESWIVEVADENHPDKPHILLFDWVNDRHLEAPWRAGSLETSFCPTQNDARRVGEAACVLLDRFPKSLAGWEKNSHVQGKRMVETLSLASLSNNFDYSNLHPIWRGPVIPGNVINHYAWPVTVVQVHQQTKKAKELSIQMYTAEAERFFFKFFVDRIDLAKENSVVSDEEFQDVLPLIRHIQYKLWGCAGTLAAMNRYAHSLLVPFLKADREREYPIIGPCDGSPGWTAQRQKIAPVQIKPLQKFVNSITGELPMITVISKSRICVAYILQQGLNAWLNGEGQLNVWQEMTEATDIVDSMRPKLLTIPQILDEYCCCDSLETRSRTPHYCMICWNLYLCSELVKVLDGRFVCQECINKYGTQLPIDFSSVGGLKAHIRRGAWFAHDHDAQASGRMKDPQLLDAICEKLYADLVAGSLDQWNDAWDGQRSWSDATYTDLALRSIKRSAKGISHPLNCSVEAVYPFCLVDGVVYLHHPANVVLASWGVNRLHGMYPVFVLPWCRLAIANIEREQTGEPRDLAFWVSFRNAMDCAMVINLLTPHLRAKRFKQKLSTEQYHELLEMWKTGRPSKKAQKAKFHPFININTQFKRWTREDIRRLEKLIGDFEKKHPGRHIPRSKSGAPWLFDPDHMPEDWSWDDVFNFFNLKYHRAKHMCNAENETKESPDNFLMACVIWYLKTGGKDEFFGCFLTIYTRHPFVVSVGRASDVLPGSRMATGFTCLHPSSTNDYNPLLCSITFEGWITNLFKTDFDISLFKTVMLALIRDIPLHTVWYDAPAMDLPAIQFPSLLSRAGSIYRDPQDVGGDGDDSGGGDGGRGDDDDEDEDYGGEEGTPVDDTFGLFNDRITDEDELPASDTAAKANGGQQKSGQTQGQGNGGQPTTITGAGLIDLNSGDFQPDNAVPPAHPLYGKALSAGNRLGLPTVDGRFVDSDGLVGMYLQEGDTIHVCAKFGQVVIPPPPDFGFLEAHLIEQQRLTITHGQWRQIFTQHNPSGVGLRCLWNAVAFTWSGDEKKVTREAIRDRVQALLLDVLSGSRSSPANPAQRERADLYHALNERTPDLINSLKTMEMGDIDDVQLIADALDAEIFMYVPRELREVGGDVLVGSWDLLARGQPHPPERQIHLVNYPNAHHWTVLWPLFGDGNPPVSDEARLPIPDFPELGAGPLLRLAEGDEGNQDLRHDDRRRTGGSMDGHVADMRPFPDATNPEFVVHKLESVGDETTFHTHPMSGVVVVPWANKNDALNHPEQNESFGRHTLRGFNGFVDAHGTRLAQWERPDGQDVTITSMTSGREIARFHWGKDAHDKKLKWKHLRPEEGD